MVGYNHIEQFCIKEYNYCDIFEAIVAFSNRTLNATWFYQLAPLIEIISDVVLNVFPE